KRRHHHGWRAVANTRTKPARASMSTATSDREHPAPDSCLMGSIGSIGRELETGKAGDTAWGRRVMSENQTSGSITPASPFGEKVPASGGPFASTGRVMKVPLGDLPSSL